MKFNAQGRVGSLLSLGLLLACTQCVLPDFRLEDDTDLINNAGSGGQGGDSGLPPQNSTGGTTGGGTGKGADNVLYDGTSIAVYASENTAGIQGSFYVLEDGVDENMIPRDDGFIHTDLSPDTFSDSDGKVCVSGILGQATTTSGASCLGQPGLCNWGDIWGGGFGININTQDGQILPFDLTGINGFDVKLSGDIGGATLRMKLAPSGGSPNDYCKEIIIGANRVALSEIQPNCWPGGASAENIDLSQVESIQFQLVTSAEGTRVINNLCLESLSFY